MIKDTIILFLIIIYISGFFVWIYFFYNLIKKKPQNKKRTYFFKHYFFCIVYLFDKFFDFKGIKLMIIVTGGAGFIGSNLINHLLRSNKSRIVSVDWHNSLMKITFQIKALKRLILTISLNF